MTEPRLSFVIPGYALGAVRRADGSGGWLVEAHDTERRRPVLLKVIERRPEGDAAEQRIEERLRREARAAARVHHPAVVRVYDLGETAELLYLVMESVAAPDADTVVRRDGPLPVPDACRAARDVARGLAELHRAGVIHRDLTPANVLLPAAGNAVIVDLGLARLRDVAGGLTAPDVLLGTPAFMAPEQAEDPRNADGRADLYALGATLFFLLTGRGPFEGEGLEALRRALRGGAPDVRTLRPDCSPPLARLLQRLLARRPDDRPANAAEVAGALDAVLDDQSETQAAFPTPVAIAPVQAPAADAALPEHRWVRLAGFLAGMGAFVLLAVLVSMPGTLRPRAGDTRPRGDERRRSDRPPPPAGRPADRIPPVPDRMPPPPPFDASARTATAARLAEHGAVLPAGFLYLSILQHAPSSFEAARIRSYLRSQRSRREREQAFAESQLLETVDRLLAFGRYRDAAIAVDRASAIGRDARRRWRERVETDARAGFLRAVERSGVGGPRAIALLEAEAAQQLPAYATELRRLIDRIRNPRPARDRPAATPDGRPLALLERDLDDFCRRCEPETAIALIDATTEHRAALAPRRAEAQALDRFLRRLRDALATRTGSRIPLPGGGTAQLAAVRRGELDFTQPGAAFTLRLGDADARWTERLAQLALTPVDGSDAAALALLLHLDGHDRAARDHATTAGIVAARVRTRIEQRLAAARVARETALLDEARRWRQREDADRVRQVLQRIQREGVGSPAGPAADERRALGDWAGLRLSGLHGLLHGGVRLLDDRGTVELTWRAATLAPDIAAAAHDMHRLAPRLRGACTIELVSPDGWPRVQPVAVGLESANGLRADLRLLVDGRWALSLDGAEVQSGAEGTQPIALGRARRGLTGGVGGVPFAPVQWAGEGALRFWVSDLPEHCELRIRGTIDPAWIREARAAARAPSTPQRLTLSGPPRRLRVHWDAPERGKTVRYRVWVATAPTLFETDAGRTYVPMGVFRMHGHYAHAPIELRLDGAVAGVYVEPVGEDQRAGPATPVRYAADLRGAGAIAAGPRGTLFVTVPGERPLIRLRADGLPEPVPGAPEYRDATVAARGVVAAPGRYGPTLAMTDARRRWAWAWTADAQAQPFGHGRIRAAAGVAVDAYGHWWVADPAGRRLYNFWGKGLRVLDWIVTDFAPADVTVLRSGHIAASDPAGDRVALFHVPLKEGWYVHQRDLSGLPGASALAAGTDGRLWVATGSTVTVLGPADGAGEPVRTVIRKPGGVRLSQVTDLATAPDGSIWVLDGRAGQILQIRP